MMRQLMLMLQIPIVGDVAKSLIQFGASVVRKAENEMKLQITKLLENNKTVDQCLGSFCWRSRGYACYCTAISSKDYSREKISRVKGIGLILLHYVGTEPDLSRVGGSISSSMGVRRLLKPIIETGLYFGYVVF